MSAQLDRVLRFLRSIGIAVTIDRGSSGFLPGVRIVNGELRVDPQCFIDDLLHESGHLAITPRRWRQLCNDDVTAAHVRMFDDIHATGEPPDSPLYRAALQSSESEAISWGWAAGVHLGLPPEVIISDRPEIYEGHAADVRAAHMMRSALGVHGLAHAGFTSTNGLNGRPRYPAMAFWTQEIDFSPNQGQAVAQNPQPEPTCGSVEIRSISPAS